MGLVSYLASRPQVFRVAPFHKAKVLNAVARAISQSATITDTPLTDAGLDGSGEVIQVMLTRLFGEGLTKQMVRVTGIPCFCPNTCHPLCIYLMFGHVMFMPLHHLAFLAVYD